MEENSKEYEFSQAVILLMKGAIQRDEQQKLWNIIMEQQAKISDYVAKLGLFLIVDKTAGYAFLRQDDNTELPRLVNRHQLGYGLSILLIMLRKGLARITKEQFAQFMPAQFLMKATVILSPFFYRVKHHTTVKILKRYLPKNF